MKDQKKMVTEINNIVRLNFDADFYVDRAMRATSRCQYEKAVKYFRLAIEIEPENTYNYLNLAGLLSELGRFEESNELLEVLLYEVAPTFFCCLFYLANNLMSIGELELAEDYLFKYIQSDPNGEYKEEAEELLEAIACELGRAPGPSRDNSFSLLKQEEARYLLESGDYGKAKEILEEMVSEQDVAPPLGTLQLVYSRKDPVLECFIHQMGGFTIEHRRAAKNLWIDFISGEPKEIIIRKAETWAAAIEYIISMKNGYPSSQREVALKYNISTSGLNRNLRRIIAFMEKAQE